MGKPFVTQGLVQTISASRETCAISDFQTPSDHSHKTRTHLDDPVSCLDAGSHSGSIYDTRDRVKSSTTRLVYLIFFFVWLVLAEPQIVSLMLPSTAGWWKSIVECTWVSTDLPSLTSCTNTGLSPLTVSPKPFSSLWIITQRWTRPEHQRRRRYNFVALLSFCAVLWLAGLWLFTVDTQWGSMAEILCLHRAELQSEAFPTRHSIEEPGCFLWAAIAAGGLQNHRRRKKM